MFDYLGVEVDCRALLISIHKATINAFSQGIREPPAMAPITYPHQQPQPQQQQGHPGQQQQQPQGQGSGQGQGQGGLPGQQLNVQQLAQQQHDAMMMMMERMSMNGVDGVQQIPQGGGGQGPPHQQGHPGGGGGPPGPGQQQQGFPRGLMEGIHPSQIRVCVVLPLLFFVLAWSFLYFCFIDFYFAPLFSLLTIDF